MRNLTRWLILLLVLVPWAASAQVADPIVRADTITADEDAVTLLNLPSGRGSAAITVSNYCSCTLVIEGRAFPNADWEAISGAPTISADGVYSVSAAGLHGIRVRASAWTMTTTTITIRVSSAGGGGGGSAGIAGSSDTTEATQLNVLAGVDGVEALLTTIDSDTSRLTSSATNIAPGAALATTSFIVGARYVATPPTFTNGQEGGLQISSAGRLLVELPAGGSGLTDTELRATAVPVSGTVTVTDGAGALNVIVDSATLGTVTVSDGAGALNVIVDSGTITAVTTITNAVTVTDGAGALNVICDSGCSGSGGTSLADDADFTAGITAFTPGGGFYQSTVTACTDGDTCAFGITAQRTLKATLFTAAGAELTVATDWTVGTAAGTTGPGIQAIYKDFDGAALPTTTNVDTEGEAVPFAASIKGVLYTMPTNEDGSLTPLVVEDVGETVSNVLMGVGAVVRTSVAGSSSTNGDNATFNVDALGRLQIRTADPCADHQRVLSAAIDTAASGNVEIVALNGSDLIYICAVDVVVDAAVDIQLIYGTGTACATGETNLTGIWGFAANGGIAKNKGPGPYYVVPAGNAFCIETSGAVQTSGSVTYVRTAAP